uniref:Uncharacterized protein n=1 Tax=Lepeophtheirus salmonis TaxID=72036 RepID=A0A0K2U964_LEPSM
MEARFISVLYPGAVGGKYLKEDKGLKIRSFTLIFRKPTWTLQ